MSVGPQLVLSPDQRALLNALCDHLAATRQSCMSGKDLKQALGWDDQTLFAVVHVLGNPAAYPPKQVLTYRSHRLSGSVQEIVDEVCLGQDGFRYCNTDRPATI